MYFFFIVLEIAPWLHVFKAEDAVDFSQLTFDPGQKELIAGARWEMYFLFMLHQIQFYYLISNTELNCDIRFLLYDSSFHTHSAKHC